MNLRLISKNAQCSAGDYELVDILRAMSTYNHLSVIGYQWCVAKVELWHYTPSVAPSDLHRMFPETPTSETIDHIIIGGERLMERSAVIHQIESGLFLRLLDPNHLPDLQNDHNLWHGSSLFGFPSVDLGIRRDEVCPYEVITSDQGIVAYLQGAFSVTTLVEDTIQ